MAIPVNTNMVETGNMSDDDEVQFSIGDPRWVMRSLADLYSNRELAVVREYSTNARDAMVEAGKADLPIEVTLPTAMNPYFEVKDTGIGMSEETLKNRYTKFGDSSKRDNNDVNGMLGFGCKAAVAYTNTFTVTSVFDGIKTVAVITRKPDYAITLKVILSTPTSEGNGTTVQIPVHNYREFEAKAKDFYRFWPTGTVLVNGKNHEWHVGEKIDENLYYSAQSGTSYVVMGNVGYRIENPDALFPHGMNRISFVAYVDNGAVEFTPNREDLKYSDHTKKSLHKIIDDFVKKSLQLAKDEIASATSHWEAYTIWTKWISVIGRNQVADLTFKGDKLVDQIKTPNAMRYHIAQQRYNTYRVMEWPVSSVNSAIFVTDFYPELSANHKKKVREWKAHKGITAGYVLFMKDKTLDSPWVDPDRVITWDQLKKEVPKAPPKPRVKSTAPGRLAGSFDLISATGVKAEQDVPLTKKLYYVMVKEVNRDDWGFQQTLKSFGVDFDVVKVPANRKDKFLRNYPHAQPIMPYLKAKVNLDGPSLVPDAAWTVLKHDHDELNILHKLKADEINDPKIADLLRAIAKPESEWLKDYNKHKNLASLVGLSGSFKTIRIPGYWERKNKALTGYPLLNGRYNNPDPKHATVYINAVYAARKKGQIV